MDGLPRAQAEFLQELRNRTQLHAIGYYNAGRWWRPGDKARYVRNQDI